MIENVRMNRNEDMMRVERRNERSGENRKDWNCMKEYGVEKRGQ